MARAARRPVQVRAYADRIVVRCGDKVVAEHARFFGRDRTIYNPWHYLLVLANKPGAPFQNWDLPTAYPFLALRLRQVCLPCGHASDVTAVAFRRRRA
jgi:hypothetical protein